LTSLPVASPDKVHRIQQNFIADFRLFAGLPGIAFAEGDITWVASRGGLPGNMVLRTQLPSAGIGEQIDEIIHLISQHTDQFDWLVFPSCQPSDLGRKLAARGFANGPGGTWMLADLTALPAAPAVSSRFRVELVRDEPMLAAWRQATAAGFGQNLEQFEKLEDHPFYAAYLRHGFGPDAHSHQYIGYLDDEAVTSGTLLLAGGIAGLFDISTPPAYRRQGFGSAISWVMLQAARQHGCSEAYVWSSRMGRGDYQGIGCVPHEIGVREYCWQKR
jgi:GNAT superfamily N-acetyltransferase